MTDELRVTWSHDSAILRSSMNAWWNSAVPRPSISWRLIFWVLVWVGVLVAAIILGALGLPPSMVLAGLGGVAVFLIGFATLQRTRMRAFYKAIGRHWDVAGQTTVVFTTEGVEVKDQVSSQRHAWAGIDAIGAGKASTVLRIGISMIAVPDKDLPDGLTPSAFRQALEELRSKAVSA